MNTNNLPKLYKELYQAYERGTRQIWVMNVEDIKPLELPFEFSMALAWNASSINFNAIPDWLLRVSERDFGPEFAEEAAENLMEYSHLVGFRKFEMTMPETYSIMNYHEADRIMDRWNALAKQARDIHSRLPEDRKDAFYHQAVFPAVAGANYHSVQIKRAQNYQYADERRNSANALAEDILDDFATDWDLVLEFDKLAGGKWAGIMSTPKFDIGLDTWRPSSRDVLTNISYVQTRQDFDYGFGNLGIYAQGDESASWQGRICASINPSLPTSEGFDPVLPVMTRYGPDFVTVDLFHRGDHRKPVTWNAEVPYEWLKLSQTEGEVRSDRPEQRLTITIDWDSVPEGFSEEVKFRINWEPFETYFDNVAVTVLNNKVPGGFEGFPDVDGVISIEAPHYQRSSDDDVSFEHIAHLGSRSESGSIALRPFREARESNETAQEAWVEYSIYLFGNETRELNATIYVNGGLDTDPNLPMQYSLSLDDEESNFSRLLLEPPEVGELPDDWTEAVADHVWKRRVAFGNVTTGQHTLRFRANSPELYLEKVLVEYGKEAPYAYLGPPETRLVGSEE